jgi:putative chitinase
MSSKENADYLIEAAIRAGITDKKELANFMGQMQVKCGGFGHMSESLNYSGERFSPRRQAARSVYLTLPSA